MSKNELLSLCESAIDNAKKIVVGDPDSYCKKIKVIDQLVVIKNEISSGGDSNGEPKPHTYCV